LVPESLRRKLQVAEKGRISLRRKVDPFDCEGLIKWVSEAKGPRLVILNTVQSAAVVADRMNKAGHDVLHLSTALAPIHRETVVKRVEARLKENTDADWTLVATSCVEAGMDFSFRTGFRESCSTASLIQVTGRVNRGGRHTDALVWDFRVLDFMLRQHPGFTVSRRVLDRLFEEALIDTQSPSELAKEAMRREVTDGQEQRAREIREAEDGMEYPQVSELCCVIESDTRIVVIDPLLVEALRRRTKVDHRQLLRNSVQIWAVKAMKLPVAPVFSSRYPIDDSSTLYEWKAPYDPDFLGYMDGVMPLLDGLREGYFIV
jgi:CRISPR-associated endonuclease/helicase Cas3